MKNFIFLWSLLLLAGLTNYTNAQLSVDAGSTIYTINFDNTVAGVVNGPFNGSGFAPSPAAGQLDSDGWATTGMSDGPTAFGATATTGDWARGTSTGGVISGGFYAFEVATGNFAFGTQPTGSDWTPGTMTLKILNNTGLPITAIEFSYNIKVLNDQDRSNSFNFAYSTDDVTYTAVPALDYTSVEVLDPSAVWVTVPKSSTLSGINIPASSYIYFRWLGDDAGGGGSRDEFALDDIVISASTGTISPPTHLAVTTINGGTSPNTYDPFSVTVEAQDNSNVPQNVTSNVNVALSLNTGTGNLGGTLTGTILSGNSNVIITGVTYDVAETGVSITATDMSGGLNPGTSDPFEVVPGPTLVSTMAQVRAGTIGNEYILTGEAVLTFQQSFRNQKYVQDATAGILIDDDAGVITTTYAEGDGITGLRGILGEFGNMTQFVPTEDPGAPSSNGNVITPEVVTLADLTANFDNYESELVRINSATFTDAGGTFANGTVYPITDGSKGTFDFRTTFYNVDYIGTTIPTTVDVICLPNARSEGNFVTSRSSSDFVYSGLPLIVSAFSISSTAIDLYYNVDVPSVNNGDYYLTNPSVVTFTGATIDAGDPKLVHLTGASTPLTGDLTIDEIFDDAYGSSFQFYAGISPISNTNTTNPGGTMLDGYMATFQGIVSANDGVNNVWISDAAGGYNGILVYDNDFDAEVAVGDDIIFAAQRSPFNNLTELNYPVLIQTVTTGNTPYGPDAIPGSEIDGQIAADTDPAESWEGQLVQINDVTVDSISYSGGNFACSWSDSFDATYVFYVGNNAGTFSLTVGSTYTSITGVVDWYWSGPYYRLNPRNQDDIIGGITPPTPPVLITEVMQNPDAVGDSYGEWFEVYNNSPDPVDMNGWVMKDLGSNVHTIASSVIIPAYGFAVLGNNGDPLTNGGYTPDYVFPSSFALGNSDDEIILNMPGGLDEVDRVEWDGGAVWPDPTGTSMVYTGIADEDNNDGRLWATSVSVESGYTNPTGDFGSPGTNGEDQVLTEGFSLDLKVLLEGYYNPTNDSMTNYFRSVNALPNDQPFNPTLPYYGNNSPVWMYGGTEVSPYLAPQTTDWILVELRDGMSASGTVVTFPAVVEQDGQVCSYNGSARLSIKSTFTTGMYVAIYQKNHLGIISSVSIPYTAGTVVSYDFSTSAGQVWNGATGYKELEPGVWGMVAGDMNGDGTVEGLDVIDAWSSEAGEEGSYQGTNLYPDGQIENQDKDELWAPNFGMSSQIPN